MSDHKKIYQVANMKDARPNRHNTGKKRLAQAIKRSEAEARDNFTLPERRRSAARKAGYKRHSERPGAKFGATAFVALKGFRQLGASFRVIGDALGKSLNKPVDED